MSPVLGDLVRRIRTAAPDMPVDDGRSRIRRRVVVAVTIVIGAAILGVTLTAEPGSGSFYPLTAALAVTWLVGGFLSGPIGLGRFGIRGRPTAFGALVLGTAVGVVIGLVFVVGGLITREIPVLASLVSDVLAFRDVGSIAVITVITLGNGVAEEVFFRGAVYSAVQRFHPVIVSTVLYVIATLASGNVMLGFAAVLLGSVCGILRRCTGGVLAPTATHVVWSAVMLFGLPPIFA